MRVIRIADCVPAPWKNGAGSTRELWRLDDADGMLIRVSVAEITGDQPFSSFAGTDRVILQLDGPAMVLRVDGQDHEIASPFAFPGEARVTCRLSGLGKAHDLNLMVRRGAFQAGMEVISAAAGEPIRMGTAAGMSALLSLAPSRLTGTVDVDLERHDLLLTTEPCSIVPGQDGRFVLLTATP